MAHVYDRKHPVKHFAQKYPEIAKKQGATTNEVEAEVEKQIGSMDSTDLKMALERAQNDETFKPNKTKFFPNLD